MSLELLRFVNRESDRDKYTIAFGSFVSGLCRGGLLTTINAAAVVAADGRFAGRELAFFCMLLAGYLTTKYFADYRTQLLLGRMLQRLRLRLCSKLLATGLRFIEERRSGALYAHITQDLNTVAGATVKFIHVFQSSVLLLFVLSYIAWLSFYGLLATLLTMAIGITIYMKRESMIKGLLNLARDNEVRFFEAIGDLIKGFKEIKLSSRRARHLTGYITDISEEYRLLKLQTEGASLLSLVFTQLATFTLIGILVFVIPMTGQVSALAVFQFLAAILFMIGPLESVVESIPSFNRANVSLERLQRLEQDMDRVENERVELVGVVPLLEFSRIALRGVSYHFHSGQSDDRFQLGPIDLEIERGEVLFIIGGNGSGKTTLLKILTGLYPPDTGQIIVDSTPLDERHRCAYREMFSTVFSDFHLFRLLFGIEDPEPSRVSDLLEELDLARKIHFEGDRFSSIRLSTGQRKRLAYLIARLENRRIFVFDEFGADQDPGFRRVFYHQIIPELKRQGKTVIAVTHDDHFFDCCDRVIKLDYGRIETLEREHLPANRAPVRRAAPE